MAKEVVAQILQNFKKEEWRGVCVVFQRGHFAVDKHLINDWGPRNRGDST